VREVVAVLVGVLVEILVGVLAGTSLYTGHKIAGTEHLLVCRYASPFTN
jgi:hypothetical protein